MRIIAEIGTAHNGCLAAARALIQAAKECGADFAKFQAVYADEIIHPNTGVVTLPTGEIPLFERFRELERPPTFYRDLKSACEQAGIEFLCTPFGLRSARMLADLGVRAMKIASPELNHLPLLRQVGRTGLPVFLSTGVSLLADIETALQTIRRWSGAPVWLMQCVTAYPAPETDYNLNVLPLLAGLFGTHVGVSDHSLHATAVPCVAAALGADLIEKHITLSHGGSGLDDPIALEAAAFASMVGHVREIAGIYRQHGSVAAVAAAEALIGEQWARQIRGSGAKCLAASESANYGRTNRSVHVLRDMKRDELLSETDVALLRTEKILRPGLHPRYLDLLPGTRLLRDIGAGQGLQWADILPAGAHAEPLFA